MPMTKLLIALLATGASLALTTAKPFTLYVAPTGNDRWSGELSTPAADGKDGPLATLEAALTRARAARRTTNEGGSILLRGGIYELTESIRLGPEDSGASVAAPLLIAA